MMAEQHIDFRALLRQPREGGGGGFATCFKQQVMADQRHALQLALLVAAGVKRAAIVRADQAVAADEAEQPEGAVGSLAEKAEDFGFFFSDQLAGAQGCRVGRRGERADRFKLEL